MKTYDRHETIFPCRINGVHGTCSRRNTLCYPDSVHTYPFVFLELLSSVSDVLIPPLWSVLRIKVKEPLSEGKLGRKTEGVVEEQKKRWGWEARNHSGKGMKSRLAGEGGQKAICPGENNHADSLAFHRGSILRRGERNAEIRRNKSRGWSNEMHHPVLPRLQFTPKPPKGFSRTRVSPQNKRFQTRLWTLP